MHNHLKDDTNLRLMKGNFGMKEQLNTQRSNFGEKFTSIQAQAGNIFERSSK